MSNSGFFPLEEIYRKTDKGLNIILSYYPEAQKCIKNKSAKFKIRNEKTASASIKEEANNWIIKDFGDSQKAMNPIDLVMLEENLGFKEAIGYTVKRFCPAGLNGSAINDAPKPIMKEADISEKLSVEFNKSFSKFELDTLGKYINQEICDKYSLKSVKYYVTDISEKTGKPWKINSTEAYPIYCFDFGTWKKIYQPLNPDKSFRFFYIGDRPSNFVFGLDHIKKDVEKLREIQKTKVLEDLEDKGRLEKMSEEQINEKIDSKVNDFLSDLIICSGDRDALNVASAGYNVVWLNSETASLSKEQYYELKNLSKNIYNIPDIDKTGIKQGYKLALQYIDIVTIWLPDELRFKKDFRGNFCKDATDFFRHYKEPIPLLNKIKNVSTPLRFWDIDSNPTTGEFKRYILNQTAFYNFLKANGYCRYPDKTNKYGYVYLRIDENIVEKIEPEGRNSIKTNIKDFVNTYLERKLYPTNLRNMFYRSKYTDETSMSNLPIFESFDFKAFDKDFQYWFFPNVAWKITKDGIEETKMKDINKYVWKSDIKDKCDKVKKTEKPLFEVSYSKDYKQALKNKNQPILNGFQDIDKYEIKLNDPDFIFLKFLENTSKVYWMKQAPELSEIEKKEQNLHLINKLYALGYLAHKHKNPSRPWAVFEMDAKESEIGKSFGGSGKSIYARCLEHINNTFYIGGRNPQKTKDVFIYDGVDEHTYLIIIDDADQFLDFDFFFPAITGKLNINPKNNKQFTLDFPESPKFCFTSNFTLSKIDPSTERRILYTAFSDYYHEKDSDGYYKETRNPSEDLGKLLFDEFDQDEWNKFYNLIANCIQLYLNFEQIKPPMENVEKRNLRTLMGETFLGWANEYFANTEHLNTDLPKNDILEHCKSSIPKSISDRWTSQKFREKMIQYCRYRGFIFNPENMSKEGRISRNGIEYYHIHTKDSDQMPDF